MSHKLSELNYTVQVIIVLSDVDFLNLKGPDTDNIVITLLSTILVKISDVHYLI